MGKLAKGQLSSQRQQKALKYKHFKGNKAEGQGFADVRKKLATSKYRKIVSKEKRKLQEWSEKLKKIYADADISDDDDELPGHSQKTSDDVHKSQKGSNGEGSSKKIDVARTDKVLSSSVRNSKKAKLSAFHKQQKEWEKKREEKLKKQQEIEARRQEREAAILRHKQQKQHRHKLLAKRNYKGQPNLASRMELLLEQITKRQQT